MDHYSHADRTALARAVGWLLGRCDCRGNRLREQCGPPVRGTARLRLDGSTTYCAFEPGSGAKIGPTGRVEYYRTLQPSRRGGCALRLAVASGSFQEPGLSRIDVNPVTARPGGDAPKAPLPAAFRVCRLANGRPRGVKFRVAVRGPGGIAAGTAQSETGQERVGDMRVPRDAFVSGLPPYPNDMRKDVGGIVEAYEDGMCLDLLGGLVMVENTYRYRWNSTLDDLAGFVSGLNRDRPRALRLDRVVVNHGMYMALFGNDRRTPSWTEGYPFYDGRLLYQNMSVLGGIAFLHHPRVPHDCAYALSSAQGPVFVHGPSTIDGMDDAIVVSRRCWLVEPPRGPPECPWGVRFGVERDGDADGEWPEAGE